MADLDLPADLLPLHVAALRADRAMTTAREQGGDVDAARDAYVEAALALRAHPIWEPARQNGKHHRLWQASLDAAKAALDAETAA
ncbi:hypothetical protein F7Q99_20255 [Streptomyces kaniharaensis]|uniref:Uncharacterized protein n=1 Tax=Streptomyces kaniharaensis TaxID=212423 RepID=A0A6N7KSB8_9ACTN|nr:hypothetical protein [Streptomyces kaniharaensis]MQS14532.1 hypothetical protein [Streptomyces kaniharaensis]